MKIFANLPGFVRLITCLKYLSVNKKIIEDARAAGDYENEREHILKSTRIWGPHLMDAFGSNLSISGLENLPDSGPVVIVSNHQGYADIAACSVAFQKFQFGFVAKAELSKIPLYGPWIGRIRSVFIERDDARASLKAINEGIKYIEDGFSLVIFPEGTRSRGPEPGLFLKGALKLATKPGVPIVPVSINGTYRMFEDDGRIKGADIGMIIHPPIPTEGISRQEEKALMDTVENIIIGGVRKLQAEEAKAEEE
ncbi:MAG: 1-acyl-sn-glycerol-3-phosphate acyltransferase [Clostridiales bacterium]|nr:1-acyl-sn-glycerol-3-phosphate acyltransferase [Clostridiales bacterium]